MRLKSQKIKELNEAKGSRAVRVQRGRPGPESWGHQRGEVGKRRPDPSPQRQLKEWRGLKCMFIYMVSPLSRQKLFANRNGVFSSLPANLKIVQLQNWNSDVFWFEGFVLRFFGGGHIKEPKGSHVSNVVVFLP